MKCIRNKASHEIIRVADEAADHYVHELETFEFVTKSLWKARGLVVPETSMSMRLK